MIVQTLADAYVFLLYHYIRLKIAITCQQSRRICLPVEVDEPDELSEILGYSQKDIEVRGNSALYYYYRYDGSNTLSSLNKFLDRVSAPKMKAGDIIESIEGRWRLSELDGGIIFLRE